MLVVLSQLSLPMPSGMPLTLQTFAVALCGFALGAKAGAAAVAAYLLLGAVGLPVFAQLRGGFSVFVGPTGGFLIGFLPLAALCGTKKLLPALAGLAICHLIGTLWFAAATARPAREAFVVASLPYLLKDALSVAGAGAAAKVLLRRLKG